MDRRDNPQRRKVAQVARRRHDREPKPRPEIGFRLVACGGFPRVYYVRMANTPTRTIVIYVCRTEADPVGSWRTGILWNHNTGFFAEGEAEVKDCHTGVIHHTTQFQELWRGAPVSHRCPDWHPSV